MNASKAGEVGQILRRRGISRKTRINAQILSPTSAASIASLDLVNSQADYTEENDPVEVEDVGDT